MSENSDEDLIGGEALKAFANYVSSAYGDRGVPKDHWMVIQAAYLHAFASGAVFVANHAADAAGATRSFVSDWLMKMKEESEPPS